VGLRRGWTLFRLSLRNPEDLIFYVVWGGGLLLYLLLNRNVVVDGTDLSLPTVVLPGGIAALTVFSGFLGPAGTLVVEREDGTLLRSKAVPHGMTGYVTAQVVYQSLGALPMLAVLLVPCAFLFDGVMYRGAFGWLMLVLLILLGFLATMPLGLVLGSILRKPAQVSTWGALPVIGLTLFSGIFGPVTNHAGWVQGIVQVFPTYWLGTAMRWAFLPDEARAIELGGVWHTPQAVVVLLAWSVAGLVLAPLVLRRMARRESGSAVQARMQERMQRIG